MRVLQLSSDFANQKLYDNFVSHLAQLGIDQVVYVPVRSKEEMFRNINPSLDNVEYHFSFILNKIDRLNYFGKILKTSNDLTEKVDLSSVDLSHAHFLFSDGGIALELKRKYDIPYIVAVRNADLNVFFKYLVHLRRKGISILESADKIVFLSEDYKARLFKKYVPKKLYQTLSEKSVVLPNGVDDFWLRNLYERKVAVDQKRFIYVGNFSKNKNVDVLINAIVKMSERENVHLTIVGSRGKQEKRIINLCNKHKDLITLAGRISDKKKLLMLYRESNIFVMASSYETFGLVYIEALSQGLPIIYTKGEGISGYFQDGEVGYGVRAERPEDIIEYSGKIFENWLIHSKNATKRAQGFSWSAITNRYLEIYCSSLNK